MTPEKRKQLSALLGELAEYVVAEQNEEKLRREEGRLDHDDLLARVKKWRGELDEDPCCFHMPDMKEADEDGNVADEEEVLAELLQAGVAFINTRPYDRAPWYDDESESVPKERMEETTVVFINTNDILMWGCADAEAITREELWPFLKRWREIGFYAQVELSCRKNNIQPQYAVRRMLSNAEMWTDELRALPPNPDATTLDEKMAAWAVDHHTPPKEN